MEPENKLKDVPVVYGAIPQVVTLQFDQTAK
jgi:hypothetical protein